MSTARRALSHPLAVLLTAVLGLGAALAACDSSPDLPTADELEGTWVNVDGTTIRAFDFTAMTRTYDLYLYEQGAAPALNQSGTYSVSAGRLVTEVGSGVDPSIVGQAFGNDIYGFTGTTLTLSSGSAASGRRTFTKSAALP